MDSALLRELEAFKKRAAATPTTERKSKGESSSSRSTKKDDSKEKMGPPSAPPPRFNAASSYKSTAGSSSQYRFSVLAKIVKHMRNRHLDGEDHPLALEEILDETNQLDIGPSVKNWLSSEALPNNPKIEVNTDGQRFSFKPVYKIKDSNSLLRLLKQHDLKGLGGILLDDVEESLPHSRKVLEKCASEIIVIIRPLDKKKILFYNDRTADFRVSEDFQKLWRSATVEAMDDAKIEEYLKKQGMSSMQDHGPKKVLPKRKKFMNKKRQSTKPRDNEHLADVLETYEDNTLTMKGVNPK